MRTETIQLKPCPFCGATRGLYALDVDNSTSGEPQVFCDNCKAVFECERAFTIDEAIEAWNTRAERMCKNVWKDGSDWHALFECSVCGAYSHRFIRHKDGTMDSTRYCPHCGAKVITGKDAEVHTSAKVVE